MYSSTVIVVLLYCTTIVQLVATEKPNLVIIVADDMGWNDVGFHGSEIPTPNLDALAYNGIILNRHYALPSCTPSRSALLTGKYPYKLGMQEGPLPASTSVALDPKEIIMPQYFKELGYNTHLVGKWHLGYPTKAHLPTNRGFETFFGYLNGYLDYYDGTHFENGISGIDAWRNTTKAWQEFYDKYATTLISDEAVNVIDKHAASGKQNGLFMVVGSPATHRGNRDIHLEPPPFTFGERLNNITDRNRRVYADMMKGLDDCVGNITEALNRNKMINNSVIVFISDNGAATTDTQWHYENHGSNWPLKGEKMSLHEGGVRTVATIWSSEFTNLDLQVQNRLFHISDWFPTLFAAAGGDPNKLVDIDGINHWDSLKSGKNDSPRKELVVDIQGRRNVQAYIKGKWKLIRDYERNDSRADTDDYHGMNLRGKIEYNITEIFNSKVGLAIKRSDLNENTIERLRNEATIAECCTPEEKEKSQANDCHSKYCLYNIDVDPCECNDIAATNSVIVQQLASILEEQRKNLVEEGSFDLDSKGFPGESNYWEPWLDNEAAKGQEIAKPLMVSLTGLTLSLNLARNNN
ncbi:hypothetical protein O3M35_001192 [Rhynocoris fuscipes]|uniref:Sulfatase N-terminal domain-containing protein n=1 Tax=Rhynocoris fuscipes TaxID=488301 RepID=A0AAW1DU29_9HEMI